jgi:hypothetical protein
MAAQLGQGTRVHVYRQGIGTLHTQGPNLPYTHSPWAPDTILSNSIICSSYISDKNSITITSGSSFRTDSSPAAFVLIILDGEADDAPRQETWINLMIPPCSLAICVESRACNY